MGMSTGCELLVFWGAGRGDGGCAYCSALGEYQSMTHPPTAKTAIAAS